MKIFKIIILTVNLNELDKEKQTKQKTSRKKEIKKDWSEN